MRMGLVKDRQIHSMQYISDGKNLKALGDYSFYNYNERVEVMIVWNILLDYDLKAHEEKVSLFITNEGGIK